MIIQDSDINRAQFFVIRIIIDYYRDNQTSTCTLKWNSVDWFIICRAIFVYLDFMIKNSK